MQNSLHRLSLGLLRRKSEDKRREKSVSLEGWREIFYKRSTADTQEAKRKAFERARKDLVEKDFQTIKNILHLRPIRHRQDDKVQAHVSICMLSLLLERLLEKSLNHEHTAKTVLDQLNTCHLNKYEVSNKSLYTITKVDKDQASILKSLKLTKLGDDAYLNERISQR